MAVVPAAASVVSVVAADAGARPFTLGDGAVVAVAAAAVAGAWRGGGPGLTVAGVGLVVAVAARRPWLLCAAVAVLAATLADRALAGLDPVAAAPVRGWATLVTDPEPLDNGGLRVDVRLDGRRLEAMAFGRPAHELAGRLAGERVEVDGRQRPPPDDAPWLVARRVVGRLTIDDVRGWQPGSPVSRAANAVRRTLDRGSSGLSITSRSLLAGVVLGDDRFQPPEVTDDFRAAGLSHLLAVSGQNVVFVLAIAAPLLTRLRWSARLPATLAILAAFALLVRFEPSVLRAAAMAAVATFAAALGRPAAGIRILGLAVTALVLVDPLLVRSVGFGLSVSASAAILVLGPRLRTVLPGPRWLAEPLAVTLAAQVGTAPLLLTTFGGVPVAAVPANLLAVPAAAPLMIWGVTAGLLAGMAAWAASVLHLPTSLLTWWLARVARWAAALPLGEVRVHHAAALAVALAACLALRHLGVERTGRIASAVLATTLVLVAAGRPTAREGATSVGRAASLWRGGGATALLLDGPAAAEPTLEAMRQAGVRCVDVVAVGDGGRAAAATAGALQRRCPGTAVVAPAGEAHPGWHALPRGAHIDVGALHIRSTDAGELRVGSGADGVARAPPSRPGRSR